MCAQWKPQHSDLSPALSKPSNSSAEKFPFSPAKDWSTFQGGIWLEGLISEPCQEDDIVQVLNQPEPARLIIVVSCLYGVGYNKLMDRSTGKMNFLPLSIYSSNECLQEPVTEENHLPNHFIFTARSLHSLLPKGVKMGHHPRWGVWLSVLCQPGCRQSDEFMKNKRGENIKFK